MQSDTNPVLNQKLEKEDHGFFTKIGGLLFRVYRVFNKENSNMIRDDSFIELSNNETVPSKLRISAGGHVLIKSAANTTINSSGHRNETVKGTRQVVIAGKDTVYNKSDKVQLHGSQTDKEKQAAENLQKITEDIQQKRIDAIKNTKGLPQACPVCSVTHLVDTKSSLISRIFAFIRRTVGSFFCFPIDIIQKLANTFIAPILSRKTNIALTAGKACGSPACKNGAIESPIAKLKAADQVSAKAIKANEKQISEYSKILGAGGAEIISKKSDVIHKVGLKKNNAKCYQEVGNHTFAFYFVVGSSYPNALAYQSKGSAPKIVHIPPQETHGSMMLDIANKFTINAGSPGIELVTTGRIQCIGGDVVINATEGEALFGSGNVTTIKGKNVIIDADDRSGDCGFAIQSPHTMVNGSFNVKGDCAVKGHLTSDGALSVPYLIVPSMRTESTAGASSKQNVEWAQWSYTALAKATANFAIDAVFRYAMTGYIMTIAGLYAYTIESVNLIMLALPIEPMPTGFALGFIYSVVYNFPHTHGTVGNDHSHSVTIPKGSYWNDVKSWGSERKAGSSVPTPSPINGDTPSPGPKSKGGACGGGGLYTQARNEKYKLKKTDPYDGRNFIPLNIKRLPDGTLDPEPQLSVLLDPAPTALSGNYQPPPFVSIYDTDGNIIGNRPNFEDYC